MKGMLKVRRELQRMSGEMHAKVLMKKYSQRTDSNKQQGSSDG